MSPHIRDQDCLICGKNTTFETGCDHPRTYYGCDCHEKEHHACVELINSVHPNCLRTIANPSGCFTFDVTLPDGTIVEIQQEHQNIDPQDVDDHTIWVILYRTNWKQFD